MGVLATIADVKDAVTTSATDRTLQRLIDTAEEDIRRFLGEDERETLPVVVWTGAFTVPAVDGTLTVATSILTHNYVRFEGRVGTTTFSADTAALDTDGGSETLTPMDADGNPLSTAAFTATIDSTGRVITLVRTSTDTPVLTRILGLTTQTVDARFVTAVVDLVENELTEGAGGTGDVVRERIGQYEVQFQQRTASAETSSHNVRFWQIIRRLVLAGDESLAY